jgi:hypothetical protein
MRIQAGLGFFFWKIVEALTALLRSFFFLKSGRSSASVSLFAVPFFLCSANGANVRVMFRSHQGCFVLARFSCFGGQARTKKMAEVDDGFCFCSS